MFIVLIFKGSEKQNIFKKYLNSEEEYSELSNYISINSKSSEDDQENCNLKMLSSMTFGLCSSLEKNTKTFTKNYNSEKTIKNKSLENILYNKLDNLKNLAFQIKNNPIKNTSKNTDLQRILKYLTLIEKDLIRYKNN